MDLLNERIECQSLREKVISVEEVLHYVKNGDTIAISGFTKSGEPKLFFPALANHLERTSEDTRINLFSGASLSDEVENPIAPFIQKRGPYMSASVSRKLIHAGKMDFADVHLSQFARNLLYGFYGRSR